MPLDHVCLSHASASNSGKNDEDRLVASDRLFAIADGMGGHHGGAHAAETAIATLDEAMNDLYKLANHYPLETLSDALGDAFKYANVKIYNPQKMSGTTLCALLFDARFVLHAHVGDTRLYRLRAGKLDLLTCNHSVEHKLTRAIGCEATVKPTLGYQVAFPHDRYLLCTDGVYHPLTPAQIQKTLTNPSMQEACDELIAQARLQGSTDDATALLVQVDPPVL